MFSEKIHLTIAYPQAATCSFLPEVFVFNLITLLYAL